MQDDHDARAVVITAAGDEHFSVGMDLKQLMSSAGERGGFEAVLDQRLRAKKIDGPTALAIGLVHELHPVAELKAKAIERYNDNPDATHFFEKRLVGG